MARKNSFCLDLALKRYREKKEKKKKFKLHASTQITHAIDKLRSVVPAEDMHLPSKPERFSKPKIIQLAINYIVSLERALSLDEKFEVNFSALRDITLRKLDIEEDYFDGILLRPTLVSTVHENEEVATTSKGEAVTEVALPLELVVVVVALEMVLVVVVHYFRPMQQVILYRDVQFVQIVIIASIVVGRPVSIVVFEEVLTQCLVVFLAVVEV